MKKLLLTALLFGPLLASANQLQSISTPMPTSNFQGSVSYFGYYSTEMKDTQEGTAGLYTYHLLALNYKLSQRHTVSLRPTFTHETEGIRYGQKLPAKTKMADSHLALVDRSPLTLPGSVRSKITYKLYLPTDPEWTKAGTQAGLGADLEFSADLNSGYSLGYYPRGFLLLQTQDTYTSTENGTSKIKPTQKGQLEHWLRLTKYFGDRYSLSQGVGLKNYYFSTATANQEKNMEHPLLETSFNISVNDNTDVSLGLGQENNPTERSWQIYNPDESSYVIMTSIRI